MELNLTAFATVNLTDLDHLTPAVRWQHLIEEEFKIRERMSWESVNGPYPEQADLQKWAPTSGIKPSKQQLQEWWKAVANVWREYPRQIANGNSPTPPPADLAYIMAGLCFDLAVGKMPEPMSEAISEGRTSPSFHEHRDIGLAVAYHKAAKIGIVHNGYQIKVQDATPTKTISQNFGVASSTVRKWIGKNQAAFLGVNDILPETLVHLMEQAGETYTKAGRSHSAIAKRSKNAL
jgi:hypothetical protein